MNDLLIETTGLTKRYGVRVAVNRVNLQIPKGQIYGFLGPNGAGKTTTIRMLLGLIRPTGGNIRIFGKSMPRDKQAILGKVGSLVESPSYYGHLTARENLEAQRIILDVPKARIDEVLRAVRLDKEASRAVKGFSLGMKQRLGIAAAMLGNPELLILDEPTNGLDPAGIHEIRELIKAMPREYGVTVLVSSHLLSEIDLMVDHVGIINKGEMLFQDKIEVLRRKATSSIRLRVSQPEEALHTLAGAGCLAVRQDGALLFDQPSDDKVAEIVHRLVGEGQSVYRVEAVRRSLEDIFLDMVGGGNSL